MHVMHAAVKLHISLEESKRPFSESPSNLMRLSDWVNPVISG